MRTGVAVVALEAAVVALVAALVFVLMVVFAVMLAAVVGAGVVAEKKRINMFRAWLTEIKQSDWLKLIRI